jgi:RsiW-degrading membrane proteinase PrsW (M82 family)
MPVWVRRYVLLVLPAMSILGLWLDAPGPVFRELYFVGLMLTLTFVTRSTSWRTALYALSLGIGVAAPAVIILGWLFARAGVDVSESAFGSWGIVPILEECVKVAVVVTLAWLYRLGTKVSLNPSDWLLVGCAVGAGFAMVENAALVRDSPSVLRDMRLQYGPSWIVPGAWGVVGYVGHAAATGLAAAGIGVGQSFARVAKARGASPVLARAISVAPLAWVTVEHVLANLHVNTGSDWTFILSNGRVTPWLFVAALVFVLSRDYALGQRALAHSAKFRRRREVLREALIGGRMPRRTPLWRRALVAASEFRLLNAAAWVSLERLTPGGAGQ